MSAKNFFFLIIACSLFSCGSCRNDKQTKALTQKEIDEQLIEVNKQLIKDDQILIDNFVEQKGWKMRKTGTGLRYWFYAEGTDTTSAKSGMRARVSYEVRLLDGTLCSQTGEGQWKEFVIGYADIETGIHEAIALMTPGDKAKLILPPHLAYGLTGDMGKIPLHSILVYDMTLISLK